MKSKYVSVWILIFLMSFLSCLEVKSQINKVGIVFDADTTLICQYIGLTIFSNSTNELPLDVNMKDFIVQNLKSYLETEYAVDVIELPDSLRNKGIGMFDSDVGRKTRKWAKTKNKDYNIIVFIRNQEIPRVWNVIVPQNTNGLYSRKKSRGFLYTTITFHACRTSNAELLEYYNLGGGLLYKLKNFEWPKDKKTFTPETLTFLGEEYKKYLDQRLKHFLSKTYLIPSIK